MTRQRFLWVEGYGAFVRRHSQRLYVKQKGKVEQTLREIRQLVSAEQVPSPTAARGKCAVCEFHRFCNDVV